MELTDTNTIKNSSQINNIKNQETFSVERLKTRTKGDKRNYKFFNNNFPSLKKEKTFLNIDNINKNHFNTISNDSQIPTNLKEFKMFRCASLSKKSNYFLSEKMPYIPDKERKKSEQNFICLIKELIKSQQLYYSKNFTKDLKERSNNLSNDFRDFCKKSRNDPFKPKGYNFYEFSRINPSLSNDEVINYADVQQKVKDYNYNKNFSNKKLDKFINKGYKSSYNSISKLNKFNNLTDFENNKKTNNKIINTDNNLNKTKSISFSFNNNRYLNTIQDNNFYNQKYNRNKIFNFKTLDPTEKNFNNLKNDFLQKISIGKNKLNLKHNEYSKSDVFNLNKEDDRQKKTSEEYSYKKNYFKVNNKLSFPEKTNINSVGWTPKDKIKFRSRIGCPSVPFNILSPSLRDYSPMKKEIDKLNNYKFFKAPLISGFKNLTKLGNRDLKQEYLEQLNKDANGFHKNDYCTSYNSFRAEQKNLVNDID